MNKDSNQQLDNAKKIKNKKLFLSFGIGFCLIVVIALGVTYAYWTTTKVQEDENVINTTCLDITYKDVSAGITLDKTFPISDEEGMKTAGYQFTLTNNCNRSVEYQVNLESLNEITEKDRINIENLKVVLDDNEPKLLNAYSQNQTNLLNNTYDGRQLTKDILSPKNEEGSTRTYTLRIWLDKDTPDGMMNKNHKSKITVFGTVTKTERATNFIKKLKDSNPEQVVEDDTQDKNIRFIGTNPNNYVNFNGELWRIIGVMNNVKGGSTDKNETGESRIKLIKDTSLGKFSWDYKQNGLGSSLDNAGSNKWSDSQLMMMLNPQEVLELNDVQDTINEQDYVLDNNNHEVFKNMGSYFDHESGYKPASATTADLTETTVDFSKNGLTTASKNLIDIAYYNIGVTNNDSDYKNLSAKKFYEQEKNSSEVAAIASTPSVNGGEKWLGYVGLINPSDYGYGVGGTNRENCLNFALSNWNDTNNKICHDNDWLYETQAWTMLGRSSKSTHKSVLNIHDSGHVNYKDAKTEYDVYPVVYLKSNVNITKGKGTKDKPYELNIY